MCIILKCDMSQQHNGHPVLYRITTSPNSKGRLEGTAEAVAGSDSLKSADSKEIKQSKVAEAKGKRQLKVVAGVKQKKSKMRDH